MAGLAQTEAFALGSATVMIGAMADLMSLDNAQSIGLVKNIAIKSAPSFTDLTQGVKNTLVSSVMTGNDVTVEGEVYEYTARNISYNAGLDGTSLVTPTAKNMPGVVTSATTLTLDPTDAAKLTAGAEGVGDLVMVQSGTDDQVMIRRVSVVSSGLVTIDPALPVSFVVSSAIKVSRCNNVAVGSQADQPFLACKIVGTMANGDEIVILLPKIRITSGLSVAFKTDNFDNMPLAMKLYDLVTTDTFYSMFQKIGPEGRPAKAMLSTLQ